MTLAQALSRTIDNTLEVSIVTSFTRIGYHARRRLERWRPAETYDFNGRVVVLTGATSGLGKAAATQLARGGATLVVVGRDAARNELAVGEIVKASGNTAITQVAADLGNKAQVRALAQRVLADHDRLDVLVHNAGALNPDRQVSADGTEATVASQVVGPFLLTSLLLTRLSESAPSLVLTMSSGGMYTAGLTVSELEMSEADYQGSQQYARAKRAQVTLNELWATRFGDQGVHYHALHPGWADTPGVRESLPGFARIFGPLLRTPDEGADTLVWLAGDDKALAGNGGFWLDRRTRPLHRLPKTRRTDTPDQRAQLWDWVAHRAGMDVGQG